MTSRLRRRVLTVASACLLVGGLVLASSLMACSSKEEAKAPAPTPTSTAKATATARATATATSTSVPSATSAPEPSATAEPPTNQPTQAVIALPTASNPPPADTTGVEVSPAEIGQGQTAMIRLWGQSAASALAVCDGRNYPLVLQDGYFWGIIAAAGDADPGVHAITVELFDSNGDEMAELSSQVSCRRHGIPGGKHRSPRGR